MSDTNTPHIDLVRQKLMATLDDLCNKTNPMDIKRALAIKEVAAVLVDTARVENDYLKLTKQTSNSFFGHQETGGTRRIPGPPGSGITSITQHMLGD